MRGRHRLCEEHRLHWQHRQEYNKVCHLRYARVRRALPFPLIQPLPIDNLFIFFLHSSSYEDSSGGKSGVSDGVGFPVSATFEKFTFESSLSSYENPMVNLACVTSDTCGPFTFSSLDLPTGATVACDNEGTVSGVTCGTTDVVSCN